MVASMTMQMEKQQHERLQQVQEVATPKDSLGHTDALGPPLEEHRQ